MYQFPMGKVKGGRVRPHRKHENVSIPYGKGKAARIEIKEGRFDVSIPYGKGKAAQRNSSLNAD